MSVREKDSPAFFTKVQEGNLLRQYDLLLNCIEIGLEKGIEIVRQVHPLEFERRSCSDIVQFGGRYRKGPIYVGNHIPPHFNDVPDEMDRSSPDIASLAILELNNL